MQLEGEYTGAITLAPLSLSDLPYYCIWFNDERVRAHLYPTTPRSPEDIAAWLISLNHPSIHYRSIQSAGRSIGHVGLRDMDGYSGEISYVIGDPAYWNKGIATIAVRDMLEIARTQHSLSQVTASFVENPASRRVLEKLGFISDQNFSYALQLS